MIEIRPMELDDAVGVTAIVNAANEQAELLAGREPEPVSHRRRALFVRGMRRFVERDPEGAWVATDDGELVGMAEAIRRGSFWGLSMLFVAPSHQGMGLGRRLLDSALASSRGASLRMILTSADPRALRLYALAGLDIHPSVQATGAVDRSAIPAELPGRAGDAGDLELVADVDAQLRGSRAEDVAFRLEGGDSLQVIDRGASRGFVVHRGKWVSMLGATDDATAALLMWRFLAHADGEAEIWAMTAQQNWAVSVALAAGLRVAPAGPLFISGRAAPPGPWLPSGWYF